ncbi:hypothetical protein BC941DRAFT_416144 [Chlamydoabsidia padenii]|nr:hypothetical protein BC941DRAFT_416144 [Chlamydoabsidia padenii]
MVSLFISLEIAATLLNITDTNKVVLWDKVIEDLQDFIIENYDGKILNVFRGDWKRCIKAAAKAYGLYSYWKRRIRASLENIGRLFGGEKTKENEHNDDRFQLQAI